MYNFSQPSTSSYPRRHPFFKRVPTLVSIHAVASAARAASFLQANRKEGTGPLGNFRLADHSKVGPNPVNTRACRYQSDGSVICFASPLGCRFVKHPPPSHASLHLSFQLDSGRIKLRKQSLKVPLPEQALQILSAIAGEFPNCTHDATRACRRLDAKVSVDKNWNVDKSRWIPVLAALFCVLSVASAMAQTFRGGVSGTVADKTGAMIPTADVKIERKETGLRLNVT